MKFIKKLFITIFITFFIVTFNQIYINAAYEVKNRLTADKTIITVGESITVKINESIENIDFNKNTKITSWSSSDNKILKVESTSSTDNSQLVARTVYSKDAKVTGIKEGKVVVRVNYETQFGTQSQTGEYYSEIEITVKSKEEALDDKEEEKTSRIEQIFENRGFIRDSNSKKLDWEENGSPSAAAYHKFGKSKQEANAKTNAKTFIDTYINAYADNSKIEKVNSCNLPKDIKFTKNESDGGTKTYSAEVGFKFTAKEAIKIYGKETYRSQNNGVIQKSIWKKITLTKGKEYTAIFNIVYETCDKMFYSVIYSTEDGEEVTTIGEKELTGLSSAIDTDERLGSIENEIHRLKTEIAFLGGEPRDTVQFTDVMGHTDYYTDVNDINSAEADRVEKGVSKVLSVITNIGILVSIIIPAVVGVKYMISSVEEKAEYKKDMIPYIVGAFLLFGISIVIKILQNFGDQINTL